MYPSSLPGRSCSGILLVEANVFGSLGVPEIILIFVVALILFGPRQMPQIGKSIGKALGEFRRASNDFKRTIEDEVAASDLQEVKSTLEEVREVGRDVASLRDVDIKDVVSGAVKEKDPGGS